MKNKNQSIKLIDFLPWIMLMLNKLVTIKFFHRECICGFIPGISLLPKQSTDNLEKEFWKSWKIGLTFWKTTSMNIIFKVPSIWVNIQFNNKELIHHFSVVHGFWFAALISKRRPALWFTVTFLLVDAIANTVNLASNQGTQRNVLLPKSSGQQDVKQAQSRVTQNNTLPQTHSEERVKLLVMC